MAQIYRGRHSAHIEGDFVVFLIGARINRPWKLRNLPWFARTMPRMLEELEQQPEAGLLGYERGFFFGGPAVVQYWRSFEHLERFARDADSSHLPAWKAFNQRIRDNGDYGIWHETYKVRADEYEAIYGSMPRVGLAKAGEHTPLGTASTAATRSGTRADDRAPVEAYLTLEPPLAHSGAGRRAGGSADERQESRAPQDDERPPSRTAFAY